MDRKKLFFDLLDSELGKEGFAYIAPKNAFVKKVATGEYKIRFEAWPAFSQVLPKYDITINEIEEIKKKAWGKSYKKSWTLGHDKKEADGLVSAISPTYTVENVQLAAKEEIAFYHSFVKAYFENYSDIGFLEKKLNTTPDGWKVIAYNHAYNSFLAIIAAKLTNSPKLPELIEFYRPVVKKYTESFMEKYELLAKYLLDDKAMQSYQSKL